MWVRWFAGLSLALREPPGAGAGVLNGGNQG